MLKIILIGNLGKDAEVKAMDGGGMVINFNVAVNQSYTKAGGEKVEKTAWIDCAIWKNKDQGVKIAEYLKKGTKVYIEGEPSTRGWTKDNVIYTTQSCRVLNIELLGAKQDGTAPAATTETMGAPAEISSKPDDDDLPF